jgi:hypothetical protein
VTADCPPPPALAAALSSTSQSVAVGTTARTVAIVNNVSAGAAATKAIGSTAAVEAVNCGITQLTGAPTAFTFQALDPTTDQPIAPLNQPVSIDPGGSQRFLVTFTPLLPFFSADLQLGFNCANADLAPVVSGVNTLRLTATALGLSVSVSPPTVAVGQTLVAGGSVTNGGFAGAADFYVGILRPDQSVQFFTSTGVALGHVTDLTTFRPLAVNVPLATPFSVSQPGFHAHQRTAGDLAGTYTFFILATPAGAVAAGSVTTDQVLGLATATYTFP